MTESLHLFYTSDRHYLMPTRVSICSAAVNCSDQSRLVFHVLDCGIDDAEWLSFKGAITKRFPDLQIVRHKVDTKQFSNCAAYCGSIATYARILPPQLLSEDWCVFVDGDILFVDDPLKLLALRDDRYLVIGHRDYVACAPHEGWEPTKRKWFEENGFMWDPDQFVCMGFALMNLKAMREFGFVDKCLAGFAHCTASRSADQEVINAVCKGRIGYLPLPWGEFDHGIFCYPYVPSVIHFVYEKPWSLKPAWTKALSDAHRIWVMYAMRVAGLKFHECVFQSWKVYFKRRVIGEMYRVICKLPPFKTSPTVKWRLLRGWFAPRKTFRQLTSALHH